MIKFISEIGEEGYRGSYSAKVHIEIPDGLSLDDLFTEFKHFLQACGYAVHPDDEIEIIKHEDISPKLKELLLTFSTLEMEQMLGLAKRLAKHEG